MDEQNPIRVWFRKRAKMITLYGGAVGAVLSGLVAWNQLDLPRPATTDDVQASFVKMEQRMAGLESFSKGTRRLALGQEWERLDRQIRRLEQMRNRSDHEEAFLSRLRARMREVERQLENLK